MMKPIDRTEAIKTEARDIFSKGTVHTRKRTKSTLQDIYRRNGVSKTSSATDLELLGIRWKEEYQKSNETGKTISLIRIL